MSNLENIAPSAPAIQKEIEKLHVYANQKVRTVLQDMVEELFFHQPEDPIQFMINHLLKVQRDASHPKEAVHKGRGRRRGGVSAEPVSYLESHTSIPDLPDSKSLTPDQKPGISRVLKRNLLFSDLDSDTLALVIDKMMSISFKNGATIIKKGEEGNHMFVLTTGTCDCFIERNGKPLLVKSYLSGESFGELALMYNDMRAATIVATSDVILGVIDRLTFRSNVMQSLSSKRARYEEFLKDVAVLSSLDKYERAIVADALTEVEYQDGEYILTKGDPGDEFFIISEGAADATKRLSDDSEKPEVVMTMMVGDYFGELALINNAPRAANVIAVGPTKCVKLDRDSFERLLGPCRDIIRRTKASYDRIEKHLAIQRIEAISGGQVTGTPSNYRRGRRRGVSSEASSDLRSEMLLQWSPPVHPKSAEQHGRILSSVRSNLLYQNLPDQTIQMVVDAMFECRFSAGDFVIRQDENGDNFYVVDEGICDCYLNQPDGKPPLLVKTYGHGESFGELALMYDSPRAASIKARTDVILWAMDRMTFRRVLMDTTSRKRKMYEAFLETVPLLAGLDRYERAKIADALEEIEFDDKEFVIRMGDPGDTFFICVEGTCVATKPIKHGGPPVQVMEYQSGSYFGELALLNAIPRAANVIARGPLKCVHINREAFTRLLGPVSDILKRNQAQYKEKEEQMKSEEADSTDDTNSS
uniref:Camp-dependent protein kinase regulatory subunit n=1 Tax=Hirondellea gigas TaxID=1518452 RepID=A0A6A7G8V8_9CRUS